MSTISWFVQQTGHARIEHWPRLFEYVTAKPAACRFVGEMVEELPNAIRTQLSLIVCCIYSSPQDHVEIEVVRL